MRTNKSVVEPRLALTEGSRSPKKDPLRQLADRVLAEAPTKQPQNNYASEGNDELLSFVQELIIEERIPTMFQFATSFFDLYSELKERGFLNKLVFVGEETTKFGKATLPKKLSLQRLRDIDLQGKEIDGRQMCTIICSFCFGLGTNKTVMDPLAAERQSLQKRTLRKLGGNKGVVRQFRRTWKAMETSTAILTTKSSKGPFSTLNRRTDDITDLEIQRTVKRALKEHTAIVGN